MTNPLSIDAKKAALRKTAAAVRARLAAEDESREGEAAGMRLAAFADSLMDRFAPAIIAGYWPVRSEINLLPLLSGLQDRGARLCLPVTGPAGTVLRFHHWTFGAELEQGRYGIHQPAADAPQLYPDLICVPLLAFDAACQRLGYGGGYYDRTLADLRAKGHKIAAVGLAYSDQQTDQLMTGPFDEPLEDILTPEGWQVGQNET